jgi:hypothetical protein
MQYVCEFFKAGQECRQECKNKICVCESSPDAMILVSDYRVARKSDWVVA